MWLLGTATKWRLYNQVATTIISVSFIYLWFIYMCVLLINIAHYWVVIVESSWYLTIGACFLSQIHHPNIIQYDLKYRNRTTAFQMTLSIILAAIYVIMISIQYNHDIEDTKIGVQQSIVVRISWIIFQDLSLAVNWLSCECHSTWLAKATLFNVTTGCRLATSHHLNQCWSRSMSPYGVFVPQWVQE